MRSAGGHLGASSRSGQASATGRTCSPIARSTSLRSTSNPRRRRRTGGSGGSHRGIRCSEPTIGSSNGSACARLMIWPPRDAVWPAEAIEQYHHIGGACVLYVGEGPGGRTGDDVFQAQLGELSTCTACAYNVATSPCVCAVEPRWHRTETVPLPNWPGSTDQLRVYRRRERTSPTHRSWRRVLRRRSNYSV